MKEETKKQLLKQMAQINQTMLRIEYSFKERELMLNQLKTPEKQQTVKDMRVYA